MDRTYLHTNNKHTTLVNNAWELSPWVNLQGLEKLAVAFGKLLRIMIDRIELPSIFPQVNQVMDNRKSALLLNNGGVRSLKRLPSTP